MADGDGGNRHRSGHSRERSADYDWLDSPCYDEVSTSSKRRCGDESFFSGAASRLSHRLPSLSRKWKSRHEPRKPGVAESFQEALVASRSRANSTRAPSEPDQMIDHEKREMATPPPAAPQSRADGEFDRPGAAAAASAEDGPAVFATTPLLPPVLLAGDVVVRSPLQSPTVAESPHSPLDGAGWTGLPSPPLSTRPSVSSFHRRQLLPAADIPSMLLADPPDEWAHKLGHANFSIHPRPYLPADIDPSACRQLRADWETARCNFMKHLARTGEHYSTTSKIHQLTEEKWAHLDALWRRNHEHALSRLTSSSHEAIVLSLPRSPPGPALSPRIPSTNGPRSDGKFPKVGDEGIVGPMAQDPPLLRPRPSRKRAFWKFVQGVLPASVALGRVSA
jgi:hypothetical protein